MQGTCSLLKRWGSPDWLCLAGLYHAVYGNDGFAHPLVGLERRKDIAEIIGAEAEALVYFYAACDRAYTYHQIMTEARPLYKDRFTGEISTPGESTLAAFYELTFANESDIALRSGGFRDKNGERLARLFDRMSGLVSPAGVSCARAAFPMMARP